MIHGSSPSILPDPRPFVTLRQFVPKRRQGERCELCGNPLAKEHQHLIEPEKRRLACCCDACAILFDNEHAVRFRRVPRDITALPDFELSDAQWEELRIPINLAFFYRSTPAARVIATYPSPAGATESLLPLEAWDALTAQNPVLRELRPDVEALLVNRVGREHLYYRVPIDACFKLVGLIRTHWRGLSGGTEVWREINAFYDGLAARSVGVERKSCPT
jgi:hypothetical protein